MNTINPSTNGWLKKSGNFLLFFLAETMVFAIITLSPYLSKNALLGFHTGLTVVLLVASLLLRRGERGKSYWPVFYVFFVAGTAVLVSVLLSDDLLGVFHQSVTTPQGIATAKFSQCILTVVPILILMPLMGFDWRSMYLKRGRVRIWLPVAIAALIVFPALAYFAISSSQAGVFEKLLPLWPWILLFVYPTGYGGVAFIEAFSFKSMRPFWARLIDVLTAIVFAIMHTQVTYAAEMIQFLVIVLVLSLIWGFLIQKSDSLWGAVLFHAAGDCLIIFGAYASM